MDLTHRFTVPTSVDETWSHFQDIQSVAECFPGATVTSVEDDTFHGSCKVKLGPIALVYNGSGTFVEKDEAEHRFVVDAKGKDKRGNGTAGAKVTLTMADAGGSTDVVVVTDLAITGKPAQFGRGVMQDVSDKLLGQFVSCLETRLAGGAAEPPGGSGPPVATTTEQAPEVTPDTSSAAPASPVASASSADAPDSADSGGAAASAAGAPAASAPRHAAASAVRDDSLDLGATVLPILARTYWKQAAGLLAVIAFLVWWSRRS